MTEQAVKNYQVIFAPEEPAIGHTAALYFLDGHYLFRSRTSGGWSSKFVTAADVTAAFTGKEQDSGWLTPGLVRAGANKSGKWFVYSAPAQKVSIQFDGEEGEIKIPLPRTVLLGVGSQYWLWALKEERFDRNAIACAAPFPNIHAEGKVCWGANTPPRADPANARAVWELFFATPFNNHLIDRKSKAQPEDVRLALRESAGKRAYPVNDLISTMSGIVSIINHILGV